MSSQIDFRTMPANVPVLCIPRVYPNISESRIRRIFDDLNLGVLERIDIVSKFSTKPGGEKGEKFNRVFVHFRRWNNTENSNIARERLLNGKEIKIIYDDPWFWKISAYREAERKPSVPQNVEQRKPTLQFDSDDEERTSNSKPVTSYREPRRQDDRRPDDRRRNDERHRPYRSRRPDDRHRNNDGRSQPRTPSSSPPRVRPQNEDNDAGEGLKINYGDNLSLPPRRKLCKAKASEVTQKPLQIIEDEKEEGELLVEA